MADNGEGNPTFAISEEIQTIAPENGLRVEDTTYMQGEEELQPVIDPERKKNDDRERKIMPSILQEATAISASVRRESIPRSVSGRYRGRTGSWELELRLDIDGRHPTMRVSGDFYSTSGGTVSYFGSFVVDSLRVSHDSTNVIVEGQGRVRWSTNLHALRITVPHSEERAPATVQFPSFTGSPEDTYLCQFESTYFRTIQLEQDYEQTVTLFESYNTGSLPSGAPARLLSVASAYAETGIEIQLSPKVNEIPSSGAAIGHIDLKWDDAELHASMRKHFSLWRDEPQWKVWLIAATEHKRSSNECGRIFGIMFDSWGGKQRQGCAIFHREFRASADENLRDQLHTYVHELGHCFNMLHSFETSRRNALSYMNYPRHYLQGNDASANASAFWAAFPFQFDDEEIVHLRHAFRNNIIMGGNDFSEGSELTALQDYNAFSEPIQDMSGLQLELRKPDQKKNFAYGEPVVVELKLTTTDKRGKSAHGLLHPNTGFVQMAIRKPNGHIQQYKPLMQHCIVPSSMILDDEERPAIYDSAYIGYGKDGFYFDQPGLYYVRAEYYALDGSKVTSNILPIRIRNPLSYEDEEVADLLTGPEQGTLLYLVGSDSESLTKGNEALDIILQEHGSHFLADYPRFVKGFNQARSFKTIALENEANIRKLDVKIREPNLEGATELLTPVIKSSAADRGLDNITLNMTMRHLASAQKLAGRKRDAENTAGYMVDIFKKKKLKPHVIALIESQAKQII
jgi:hypothetical protein